MMRQLRDDHFAVLASGREPMEEPRRTEVWTRYTNAQLKLRELVRERRDSAASDLISVMASARNRNGEPTLSDERVALHLCEFSAAGTDTTAQGMANAVIFLSAQRGPTRRRPKPDPSLWPRVFEETLRRRPSAPFASRQATREVELSGVTIPAGDMVWVALASANNDPDHYLEPKKWNIHRDEPTDHYAFTKGRHTCLGQPLGRDARHRRGPRAVRTTAQPAHRSRLRTGLPPAGHAADPHVASSRPGTQPTAPPNNSPTRTSPCKRHL